MIFSIHSLAIKNIIVVMYQIPELYISNIEIIFHEQHYRKKKSSILYKKCCDFTHGIVDPKSESRKEHKNI